MNRREARAAAGPGPLEVPERLRVCWVEDWVEPGEAPPDWWRDEGWVANTGRSPAEIRVEWAQIEAWTRWSQAQVVWAKENGVAWSEMARYGDGQARWRT